MAYKPEEGDDKITLVGKQSECHESAGTLDEPPRMHRMAPYQPPHAGTAAFLASTLSKLPTSISISKFISLYIMYKANVMER